MTKKLALLGVIIFGATAYITGVIAIAWDLEPKWLGVALTFFGSFVAIYAWRALKKLTLSPPSPSGSALATPHVRQGLYGVITSPSPDRRLPSSSHC